MSPINRQVRLAARPSGLPRATDWEITSEELPVPAPGQFAVAVSHLSVDPAMRGWMNATASYIPPVEIVPTVLLPPATPSKPVVSTPVREPGPPAPAGVTHTD